METVTFKLETFEGPLDLLLHLIQKNKVNIYDIPIAELSRQYMEYLDSMKESDLEVTSEFVVMAAQLLYIKSKMLLPDDNEDEDEGDPRAELVDRLIEYAKYKEAVEFLSPRQETGRLYFDKAVATSAYKTTINGHNLEVTGFDYSAKNVSEYNTQKGNIFNF